MQCHVLKVIVKPFDDCNLTAMVLAGAAGAVASITVKLHMADANDAGKVISLRVRHIMSPVWQPPPSLLYPAIQLSKQPPATKALAGHC